MWIVDETFDDMTSDLRQRLWSRIALATGGVLFLIALRYTDWGLIAANGPRLGAATAAAIVVSGAWHLARTIGWAHSFPARTPISFSRLFRVRIAAEAVSYVTVRGVAGEPLKVVLLGNQADARTASAAVALERIVYIVGTTIIAGTCSFAAWVALPLTPAWSRTFLAFAIGSGLIAAGACGVLFGRSRAPRERPAPQGHRTIVAKTASFVSDVLARLLALAREDRRRVAILFATTAGCYALMALEAWVVFRAAGRPISIGQAFAIETFTRVASFASAAIPGNLGALEAASLAAAAAVGGPSGAFLALARRLRGLFWAAVGFLVYPRVSTPAAIPRNGAPPTPTMTTRPLLLYVAEDSCIDVPPDTPLAGLPLAERVVRAALRADVGRILIFASNPAIASLRSLDSRVTVLRTSEQWRRALADTPDDTPATAIGPGTIVSTALLRSAAHVSCVDGVVAVPAGSSFPVSGLIRTQVGSARNLARLARLVCEQVRANDPAPSGDDVSHGRAHLSIRLTAPSGRGPAEQTIRRATYKQTDAKVARFNRRVSLPISVALLRTPVTANMMSLFVLVLSLFSAWLFSRGDYLAGVTGGFLSLAASILDGCDGEIARLKYQESSLGCWLETIGDYSYYLAIFIGLTVGAVRQTHSPVFFPIGATALAGTVVSFVLLIFLRRTITAGRPETLHAVARTRFTADPSWWSNVVWRVSFVATRAAMPYGIFILALVNLLPVVVVLAAIGANVYWLALVLKMRHLLGAAEAVPESASPQGQLAPQS